MRRLNEFDWRLVSVVTHSTLSHEAQQNSSALLPKQSLRVQLELITEDENQCPETLLFELDAEELAAFRRSLDDMTKALKDKK